MRSVLDDLMNINVTWYFIIIDFYGDWHWDTKGDLVCAELEWLIPYSQTHAPPASAFFSKSYQHAPPQLARSLILYCHQSPPLGWQWQKPFAYILRSAFVFDLPCSWGWLNPAASTPQVLGGAHHHAWVMRCWPSNPRLHMCQASSLPLELCPVSHFMV